MNPKVFPMPTGTPLLDVAGQFGPAWSRYFKSIGDNLLLANRVTLQGSVSYVMNGIMCFCTVENVGGAHTLPYPAELPFDIDGAEYPAGATSITLPASPGLVRWYYVARIRGQA